MKNFRYFSFIILAVIFQSLGGIFGKFAALSLPAHSFIEVFTGTFYILSLGCLFLQAIIWQQALVHYPLSFAYSFMSLVNFVVLLASAILFHEGITLANIFGLILISVGIAVISQNYSGGSV